MYSRAGWIASAQGTFFEDGKVCSLSVSLSGGGCGVIKTFFQDLFQFLIGSSFSFFPLYFFMYSSRSKPHSFSIASLVRKLSGNDLYKLFSSPCPLDA